MVRSNHKIGDKVLGVAEKRVETRKKEEWLIDVHAWKGKFPN
jgi:uncharacterized protein (DUF1499 family)